jgi:hypothetical protein
MTVCRTHGGALKKSQAAAQSRIAMMDAMGEIADLMRECDIPEQHPVEGLLEVVRLSGAMTRMLTLKVGELKEEPEVREVLIEHSNGDLSTKLVADPDGFWGFDSKGDRVPHLYVQMLKQWSERYERACKTCLDAGIAERQVRLAEDQGELIATAVRGILQALDLTPEQWEVAPRVVAKQLQQLSAVV